MSRACVVIPNLALFARDGVGTHCLHLARLLDGRGDEVTIVHCSVPDAADQERWQRDAPVRHAARVTWLHELAQEPREPVQLFSPRHTTAHRLYRWLRSQDFAAIHFVDWQGNGSVCLRAKQTGRAFHRTLLTVTARGPGEWIREGMGEFPQEGRQSLIDDALERASVELADVLICPSRAMREWLESHGWRLPPVIECAPPLSQPATKRPGNGELAPRELREVVFFGRLETRKGLLPFIDALERLAGDPAFPAMRVTFLGAHHVTTRGSSRSVIAAFAARHAERFHIEVRAERDHGAALDYLRARRGALVVTPSLTANAPYAVIECLEHGFPVLASDRGGIPELVGDRAHLVPPDADAIAERLREIWSEGRKPLAPAYSGAAAAERWHAIVARDPGARTGRAAGRVSVIVPHYNQPELLASTLGALAAQTVAPDEVVVVDDGSTAPRVSEVLAKLEAEYEERGWKVLRGGHGGPAAARNAGAAASTGDALIFVDADNAVGVDLVKGFAEGLAASGADIVTCAFRAVVDDGGAAHMAYLYCPLGPWPALGVVENTIGDVCAIVRRDVFFAAGGFDVTNRSASEDWQFFLQAAREGRSFGIIPDPLFDYRIRAGSHARGHTEVESACAALRALPEAERRWAGPLVLAARGAFLRLAALEGERGETDGRRLLVKDRGHGASRPWADAESAEAPASAPPTADERHAYPREAGEHLHPLGMPPAEEGPRIEHTVADRGAFIRHKEGLRSWRLGARARALLRLMTPSSTRVPKPVGVLREYVMQSPSDQNALDLFAGEWSSAFPGRWTELRAGRIGLFEDRRIMWAADQLGGVRNKRVLELGPLEAGHTYMLESLGAESIVAVEANPRAYLKCLVVKEIVGLRRSRFLLGDFVSFLREDRTRYDVCLAAGVLYHMQDPAELIHLIGERSERVALWTHYYDAGIIGARQDLREKFVASVRRHVKGFDHTVYEYAYGAALDWAGFCGGSHPSSYWMSREDILKCLTVFGFEDLRVGCEELQHPNGPCFMVVGRRGPA